MRKLFFLILLFSIGATCQQKSESKDKPKEWTNLAQEPKYTSVINRLKKHIPVESAAYRTNGNKKIVPRHRAYSYNNGLDVEFVDW